MSAVTRIIQSALSGTETEKLDSSPELLTSTSNQPLKGVAISTRKASKFSASLEILPDSVCGPLGSMAADEFVNDMD